MRRVAIWACLLGLGCGGHSGHHDDDTRLPLPSIDLPRFSCAALATAAGECERDADCGSAQCVLAANTNTSDRKPPALSCAAKVGTFSERDACEHGSDCESGLCALTGVCLAPCASDADCQTGQLCTAIETRLKSGLAKVNACTRSAAFPEGVELARAPRSASITANGMATMRSAAGPGTSLMLLHTDCKSNATVQTLTRHSDGKELSSLKGILSGKAQLNPVTTSVTGPLQTILVPNNPEVSAKAGSYDITLSVNAKSAAELVVAARAAHGKTLDFNVFYVGGGELQQKGGFHPGDANVRAVFTALDKLYANIGITLGEVREFEVTGALRADLSVLENENVYDDQGNLIDITVPDINRLFELSAGLDEGGMNVFLISDMGAYRGLSGGIPGALDVHGTELSGVALAIDGESTGSIVTILMHESSHQMGLFHTTELNGTSVEPLADTPVCAPENDSNGNGRVDSDECESAGGSNLMFWNPAGSQLSGEQRAILTSSLILR